MIKPPCFLTFQVCIPLKTNGWLNQFFIIRTIFICNQWKMFYVEETWSPQQPMALRMEALWTTLVWIPRSRARMKRSEWVVAPKGSPTTCQFKSLSYSTKYHCSTQCFEHFANICLIKYNAIGLFSLLFQFSNIFDSNGLDINFHF